MTLRRRLRKSLYQLNGPGKSRGSVSRGSTGIIYVGFNLLKANCQTNTPCGMRLCDSTILSNRLAVIFISCKPPVEPVKLVLKYLDNIRETGITQTRHAVGVLRFSLTLKKKTDTS